MKPILLTLLALTTAVVADKTCTPSFDYCANTLIKDKGIYSLSHRPGQARPEPLDIKPVLILTWTQASRKKTSNPP